MGFSLKSITKKNVVRGTCTVLYGEGGCGKSSLLAGIPSVDKTLFISGEDGLSVLGLKDIARTPIVSGWKEFQEMLEALVMEEHPYKVIVIDTLDAIVEMLDKYVIDTFYGGDAEAAKSYGAKYNELRSEFGKVINVFTMLQNKGINIVPIIHSSIEKRRTPDVEEYDFYNLNLGGGKKKSLSEAMFNYSDNTIFMRRDTTVSASGQGRGGNRVLMTQWAPAYLAKSRAGVTEKMAADPTMFEEGFLSMGTKSSK